MLVDSHCHLNYLPSPDEALDSARQSGIGGFLCVGVEQSTIDEVLALAQRHPDVWASIGQHPEAVSHDPDWIETLLDDAVTDRVVAIGETGLDFFHESNDTKAQLRQQESFDYQLGLAQNREYPVIIHTRAAERATRELLTKHAGVEGVLHCFTESWELARVALDLGYYISISGIVTFNNADNVRAIAAKVPRDRLLVETDSPWLAPVPHRGKQNQPQFVANTARFLADLLDWDYLELEAQTTENFFCLFRRASSGQLK